MIFLLAGLPTESYKILQQIFTIYEEQKSKHAAQSEVRAKPDCRGSNFRELRNLKSSVIHSVLLKVRPCFPVWMSSLCMYMSHSTQNYVLLNVGVDCFMA